MGSSIKYQELTTWDRITVVLYRSGIFISTLSYVLLVFFGLWQKNTEMLEPLVWTFVTGVTLAVLFIHLYIGNVKRAFLGILAISLAGFLYLAFTSDDIVHRLLFTKEGIIFGGGFIAAYSLVASKESFCFHIIEGYVVTGVHFFLGIGWLTGLLPALPAAALLSFSVLLSLLFAIRKLPQPMHFDIGDKSAYT